MDDGSIDYFYNDIFDYNDDARAGAIKSNTFKILDCCDFTPIASSFSIYFQLSP